MPEPADAEFTTEELLSQAQGNATTFALATIAYLKERGLAVDDYVGFFGRRFAPGWEELGTQPVTAVARTVALNAVSVGGELGSMSGGEANAEVLITGWPDEEIAGVLGLEPSDGEASAARAVFGEIHPPEHFIEWDGPSSGGKCRSPSP